MHFQKVVERYIVQGLDVRELEGILVRIRIFPQLIVGFGPSLKQDVECIAS